MSFALERAALSAYLKAHDDAEFGKIVVLRDEITRWLSYTPNTFPHYTLHTVQHSDEIVVQLSHLLFDEANPDKPRLRLSPTEAYILLAAAYLHDAGMVASDREKAEILKFDEWKTWTTGDGGGARRWREIQELRSNLPVDETTRHFLADLQTRFLIAEFIRRRHHYRAADVIRQYSDRFGGISFNDPVLQKTIADVCIAHGLPQHELEDSGRYPDRRDIRGDQVNVRLLAILLRLGDLLDMSCDRACPMLLNAACPLPPDSLAHWTQYQRITHKMVAPDKVEIRAECQEQEEHTFLQDWCRWLVEETRNAAVSVARCHRHSEWRPPLAEMDTDQRTIIITPAAGAKYVPSRWTFELDRDLVLERFTQNVHSRPEEYIRELLQNAFDATRCKMYADLDADGLPQPESPTEVEEARRERYPILVSLQTQVYKNEFSGEDETRQVLTVEDRGIGMDRNVIERYFLQVGRSYYITDEFRKSFRFVPTSRFGVGFLSVFSSSDDVRVETYDPKSNDGPLKLRLRGAKPYILTERGDRNTAGTKVEVILRNPYGPGDLTGWIEGWCRRVEFPVVVREFSGEKTIRAETSDQFTGEWPDFSQPNAKFVIRSYSLQEPGLNGEVYIRAHIVEGRESWAGHEEALDSSRRHVAGVVPDLPADLICANGIKVVESEVSWQRSISVRVDHRCARNSSLSRDEAGAATPSDPSVLKKLEDLVRAHIASAELAAGPDGWIYKWAISRAIPLLGIFWDEVPDTIALRNGDEERTVSIGSLVGHSSVFIVVRPMLSGKAERLPRPSVWSIVCEGAGLFPGYFWDRLFSDRFPVSAIPLADGFIQVEWQKGVGPELGRNLLCAFDMQLRILGFLWFTGVSSHFIVGIVNSNHAIVQWLGRVRSAGVVTNRQLERAEEFIHHGLTESGQGSLRTYLESFKELRDFPPELYPPQITAADIVKSRLRSSAPQALPKRPEPEHNKSTPALKRTRRKPAKPH